MKHCLQGRISDRSVYLDEKLLTPYASFKVRLHSPDGFSWGYGGSGPSQLALAVLLAVVPGQQHRYQEFKWNVIAQIPQTDFMIYFDDETLDFSK